MAEPVPVPVRLCCLCFSRFGTGGLYVDADGDRWDICRRGSGSQQGTTREQERAMSYDISGHIAEPGPGGTWQLTPKPGAREAWDPVPHLAALIDGLRNLAAQDARDPDFGSLASLLTGPYAALRGGLLLDEPGREDVTTEQAIREALS